MGCFAIKKLDTTFWHSALYCCSFTPQVLRMATFRISSLFQLAHIAKRNSNRTCYSQFHTFVISVHGGELILDSLLTSVSVTK